MAMAINLAIPHKMELISPAISPLYPPSASLPLSLTLPRHFRSLSPPLSLLTRYSTPSPPSLPASTLPLLQHFCPSPSLPLSLPSSASLSFSPSPSLPLPLQSSHHWSSPFLHISSYLPPESLAPPNLTLKIIFTRVMRSSDGNRMDPPFLPSLCPPFTPPRR